ncbi:TonB-dependent receptor [Saccharospirillum alexandrii]|uniref:TonB-dependent receptor n=1 Tax=Saccharospirillum alexandrii TaxID=2448477 RepID=UPI000FD709F7|nr:TonB-dependent siderophore receptor [Saccharospirillum alexandrii]
MPLHPNPTRVRSLSIALIAVLPAFTPAWAEDSVTLDTLEITDSVPVEGDLQALPYAGGQVAPGGRIGVLGQQKAEDVPFQIIGFTEQLIKDQQANTLADVLRNDAAVQTGFGYGNYAETFMVRGFTLYGDDVAYGGLYGVLPRQIIDTSMASRVELFKGANAFTQGVAPGGTGVGGAVNIEPKQADYEPTTGISLGYRSASYFDASADVGRRFGRQQQWGSRLVLNHGQGDTAIDAERRESTAATLALDYEGNRARALVNIGYQNQEVDEGRSVVYIGSGLTAIPDAPENSANYTPSWVTSTMESLFAMTRGEYDIGDDWTVFAALGGNRTDEFGEYASPEVSNTDGDATASRLTVPFESNTLSALAGMRGRLITGPVSHQLNLAVSDLSRKTRSAYTMSSPAFATNLYDPADPAYPATVFAGGDMDSPKVNSRTENAGVAVSDTLGLINDRLLVTLGARYQSIDVTNFDYDGNESNRFTEEQVSPAFGVVFKPRPAVSMFANHMEALQPGAVAPFNAGNAGEVTGIFTSRQIEVGTKVDLGTLGGSVSLYQIDKPTAYIDPDTTLYGNYGEQQNRGLELSLYGEPTPAVRLLGSATWVSAELLDTADPADKGNQAVGVPAYRYVASVEWDLPVVNGLTARANVQHNGPQYADIANTLEVDAWTQLDLGARYRMTLTNVGITWRADIENLTAEQYWASAAGGYLTQGQPRTAALSVDLSF